MCGTLRTTVAILVISLLACGRRQQSDRPASAGKAPGPAAVSQAKTFVGREACARCHAQEEARWNFSGWWHPTQAGDAPRALAVLKAAFSLHSGHRELLEALVTVSAKAGDMAAAADYIRKLEALAPGDPRTRALLQELARSKSGSH